MISISSIGIELTFYCYNKWFAVTKAHCYTTVTIGFTVSSGSPAF